MSSPMECSKLVNPYSNQELEEKVGLHPHQMNNELYLNLKNNLKKKVEKRCNKYGYVINVHKITHYGEGVIDPENLHGIAVFNVKYIANICIPISGTSIIIKMTEVIDKLIKGKNGPIECHILPITINKNNFNQFMHIKTKKILEPGDFVKVCIKSIKFNINEKTIRIIGFLDDIATKEEVDEFYLNHTDDIL